MKYQDIQDALATLARLSEEQEILYIEGDGEVTPETEALDAEMESLKFILENEGIDSLGRWLKSKEDEAKSWKAEKAAADRHAKSAENTVAFVKDKITEVMKAVGMEAAKGHYYSFKQTESVTTKVDTDRLNELYLAKAEKAIREAGLPDFVTIKLDAKVSLVAEGDDLPDVFVENRKDTVRFTKPRAAKD